MPASVDGGPWLACKWQISGNDLDPADWAVEVRGDVADLMPLVSLDSVKVRFETPLGRLRGKARMTKVTADVTRLPNAFGSLVGQGPLRIVEPDPVPAPVAAGVVK